MTELTPEQAQENTRAAERAHDQISAYAAGMAKTVGKDAQSVIRILILINGGAAISVLAFAGQLAARVTSQPQLPGIATGLLFFAGGVVAATVTAACSYLTNFLHETVARRILTNYVPPYVHSTPWTKRITNIALSFHVVALLFVIASVFCFGKGVFVVAGAVVKGTVTSGCAILF